jgi:hypothetical protein
MLIREIFDTVKQHLLTQNKQAKVGVHCKYRLGDLKCAVGCLIKDEDYISIIEGNGLGYIARSYPEMFMHLDLDETKITLLSQLQALHDDCAPETWAKGLDQLEANIC